MEVCKEKVCCVSLKTKQVVTGDDADVEDDEDDEDDVDDQDDEEEEEDKGTDNSENDDDENVRIRKWIGAPFSCLKCKQSSRNR